MFIYSLPLLFSNSKMGSPLELLAIAGILLASLWISAPFPETDWEDKPFNYPLHQYFLYAWSAQLRLWRVFYPFFVLFNVGVFSADYQAKAGEISVSSWDDVHFMFFLPSLFWTIAVWRSSANTTQKIWAALARLGTLLVFFELGVKTLIRSQYASLFFECQEKMLDYISCF